MRVIQIKSKYTWLKHLDFMIIDLLSLLLAFAISYRFKFGNLNFIKLGIWRQFIAITSLLNITVSFFVNPHSGIFRRSYYKEIKRSLLITFYNFALASMIFYIVKVTATYSRELTIYTYGSFFCISTILKYLWKKLLLSGKVVIYSTKTIPLFVISSEKTVFKTLRNVCAGDFQLYDIKGVYLVNGRNKDKDISLPKEMNNDSPMNIKVVNVDDYLQYIFDNNITEVLVAVNPSLVPTHVYEKLISNGVGINFMIENIVGFQTEEQGIQNIGVYKTLSVTNFSFTPGQIFYLGVKRISDLVFSLVGIIFLLPLALFVKVAYWINGDHDSIFYRHERVGKNGKTIKIWKFRSMVPNADKMLEELLKHNAEYRRQWEENQKIDNDPRITKLGRFLRSTSIDELPQLINVFIGDMSLVGPRPLVPYELESHNGLKLYQKLKPGITGWWGCNGRSNIDYRERLELEYYYVKNCSLYLDLLCVFRTLFAVMKKDGAR